MGVLAWLFGGADDLEACPDPDPECGCDWCSEEWRTSVHEAGHVLAADEQGWPWEYAMVRDDPHVEMVHDSDHAVAPDDVYDYLVIFHAGHAAEVAVFGRFAGSSSDLRELPNLADRHPSPSAHDDAWADAQDVVADVDALLEVAEALFYEGTIYP